MTRIADPQQAGVQIGDCTQNNADHSTNCSLNGAATAAQNGDDILLLPGTHLTNATVDVKTGVTLRSAGPPATATVSSNSSPSIEVEANGVIHDVNVVVPNTVISTVLLLDDGTRADRVTVSAGMGTSVVCGIQGGVLIRDSLCYSTAQNARAIEAIPSGANASVTIRNVTAVATNTGGNGLRALAAGGNTMTMFATNVVAQGDDLGGNKDVNAGGDGTPASVILDHSNFTSASENTGGSITDPDAGVNGNVNTTDPLFVNAGSGDFHEQATSAGTIDLGTTTVVNGVGSGSFDPDGNARCLGSAPDIGAFEFNAAACPVPPSATAPAPATPVVAPKKKCKKKKRTRAAVTAKKKCKKKRR